MGGYRQMRIFKERTDVEIVEDLERFRLILIAHKVFPVPFKA